MKISELQIKPQEKRNIGDFVSFPYGDKFYIGAIVGQEKDGFYTINLDTRATFDGNDIMCFVAGRWAVFNSEDYLKYVSERNANQ